MDPLTLALRTESDEELVARVCAGTLAFSAIVARHAPLVYRTLRGAVGDDAQARALTSETFHAAHASLAEDRGRSFSTWLLRLALHRATISGSFERAASFRDWHVPAPLLVPELDAELALDALPDPYRLAFVLGELHGLPESEAAAVQRICPETHRARAFRARWALAAVLSADAFQATFDAYYMRLSEADRIARLLPAARAA